MSQLENLDLRYPKHLVEEYGAKAGVLMYVARHLPKIPQMPMVVKRIGEPAGEFLARVDQAGIGWPRIFRSSAIVELVGYEGDFPTYVIDTFKGKDKVSKYLKLDGEYELLRDDVEFNPRFEDLVGEIAYSPREMQDEQLPPEINVIVAEVAPSEYIGTFIKHPNRSDFYLTTIRDSAVPDCRATLTYSPKRGLSTFGNSYRNLVDLTPEIEEDLRRVFGWHDSIASLPQMDPNWAYQIEFGLCPPMLFQVRPFRKVQFADFSFDSHVGGPWVPAVIGVTGEEGEDYEVISDSISSPKSTLPILYLADLHDFNPMRLQIDKEPNGYIFYDGGGILAHGDVKAMRRSKLTIIYPMFQPGYLDGKIVNIRSQGREIKIKNKETGEEFV